MQAGQAAAAAEDHHRPPWSTSWRQLPPPLHGCCCAACPVPAPVLGGCCRIVQLRRPGIALPPASAAAMSASSRRCRCRSRPAAARPAEGCARADAHVHVKTRFLFKILFKKKSHIPKAYARQAQEMLIGIGSSTAPAPCRRRCASAAAHAALSAVQEYTSLCVWPLACFSLPSARVAQQRLAHQEGSPAPKVPLLKQLSTSGCANHPESAMYWFPAGRTAHRQSDLQATSAAHPPSRPHCSCRQAGGARTSGLHCTGRPRAPGCQSHLCRLCGSSAAALVL